MCLSFLVGRESCYALGTDHVLSDAPELSVSSSFRTFFLPPPQRVVSTTLSLANKPVNILPGRSKGFTIAFGLAGLLWGGWGVAGFVALSEEYLAAFVCT